MTKTPYPAMLALALSLPSFACGFSIRPTTLAPPRSSALSSASATATVDADATASNSINASTGASESSQFWKWRGHDIFSEVRIADNDEETSNSNNKPAVILLHGFGASTTYWRETMSVLQSEGYDVHALDLLGQGKSSKPYSVSQYPTKMTDEEGSSNKTNDPDALEVGKNTDTKVEYSINLWANMVDDYARHNGLEEVVLMGNSIGSLVALSAATGDFVNSDTYLTGENKGDEGEEEEESKSTPSRVKGLCLFNCGIGMNSRNIVKNPIFNPIQRTAINALFDFLNALIFDNEFLLRYALNNIVTKELLEDALKSLYTVSPHRVDAELVNSFYYPAISGGNGSVEAIRQIYCNDAGLTPMEYHEKYPEMLDSLPLHLVWGLEDVVTPIQGDVGTFYCDRVANNRGGGNGGKKKGSMTTIDCIKSGHMPFDDNPLEAHGSMLRWMEKRIAK